MKSNSSIVPFAFGVLLGAAAAAAGIRYLEQSQYVPPKEVLARIMKRSREEGQTQDGWIMDKPLPHSIDSVPMMLYKGGLTRYENGKPLQFRFVADAKSGALLRFDPVEN
ncbi:hypothetical protein QUW13_07270 [Enterococcus hirae]|nr:hypothetical protein [Enterococcaceae bacterium]MCI1919492.1 hypothetical protein [Enterococcaceae bacterium]MDM8213671.1 hypothetical protein [Enterococcus hirae]